MISYVFLSLFLASFCTGIPTSGDDASDAALENPGIPDLFEGDILGMPDLGDRNAIADEEKRWPDGVIQYYIHPELDEIDDLIKSAMNHYHEKTCIRFVPVSDWSAPYVNIRDQKGCFSLVGKVKPNQTVSLGEGCHNFGIVVHELGHAVGFYHEHSRSDRDERLTIHWDNIKPGHENQFRKLEPSQNILYDDLDYDSIMLYSETVFSKDPEAGLKTMTAKDPEITLPRVVDKPGLSESDIYRIGKMYDC